MGNEESTMNHAGPPVTLSDRSLEAVADHITSGKVERVVVMTGAGISTAAGIPDFRSPGTGLYANLARLNLPYAQAVFDINFFRERPEPFYYLAKELYPGQFHPTVSHAFIALLARKGLLAMNFTQNIDCLERQAGIPADLIIEAHGSFATQRCVECKEPFPDAAMKEHVEGEIVPRCEEKGCTGLVKPDIVFFGEALPKHFRDNTHLAESADLVIVMGTSLSVSPFSGLPHYARPGVPRLLFNKEQVGDMGYRSDDVLELGDCDGGVRKLADLLGWKDELEELWRGIVGEKEAERQLAEAEKGHKDIEEEVEKLTQEVESALKLESEDSPAGDDVRHAQVAADTEEAVLADVKKDVETKDDSAQEEKEADDPVKVDAQASKGTGTGESSQQPPSEPDASAPTATTTPPPTLI